MIDLTNLTNEQLRRMVELLDGRSWDQAPPSWMGRLVWYCDKCGTPEPAGPEYKHGDSEPCCLCEDGTARVMTRHEAMARGGQAMNRSLRRQG